MKDLSNVCDFKDRNMNTAEFNKRCFNCVYFFSELGCMYFEDFEKNYKNTQKLITRNRIKERIQKLLKDNKI